MTGRTSGRRREQCYVAVIDGEPVRVRGSRPLTEEDRAALAEVIAAAKAKMDAEGPEVAAERARKQQAALDRIHGRMRDG